MNPTDRPISEKSWALSAGEPSGSREDHTRHRRMNGIGLIVRWLSVALMVAGCSKQGAADPRLQSPTVELFKVEAAGLESTTFTGVVEARAQSDLGFRVGGKILERPVDVGQHVRKGQILMRLDPVDLELASAAQQANVQAARARYTLAKTDETRVAAVVKTGAVSRQEHDSARAMLESTKAQLEAAEAEARVSNNSTEYAVLSADADGVIVRTLSEPGQVVSAGQPVIRFARDGPREASVNLPERVRPDLGTVATACLYGQDRTFQVKLRQLSEAADPASRTFEARYVLEGDAASTPLGTTVTVRLPTERAYGSQPVRIPVGAVHDRGGGPGVWIVGGDSKVTFRTVDIASVGQEELILSSGVQVGETLVALGAHLLHEGQVINQTKKEKSYGKF